MTVWALLLYFEPISLKPCNVFIKVYYLNLIRAVNMLVLNYWCWYWLMTRQWISLRRCFSLSLFYQGYAKCSIFTRVVYKFHYEQWMVTDTWRRSILNTRRDNQTQYTNSLGSFSKKFQRLMFGGSQDLTFPYFPKHSFSSNFIQFLAK